MELGEKATLKHEKMRAKWEKRKGFTGKSTKWKRKWDKRLEAMNKKLEAK